MIYGIANNAQFAPLVWSVLLGLCSAIAWDVLRFFRVLFPPGSIRLFFEDVFFFAIWSIFTFLLCYAVNYGQVRSYVLLAQPFGFFAWYCFPGQCTPRLAEWLRRLFCRHILLPLFHVYCKICALDAKRKNTADAKKTKKRKIEKKCRKNVLKIQKKTCKQKKDTV